MNLSYDEKFFLMLYYQLFEKLYNPKDFSISKVTGYKVSHTQMQIGVFLAKQLGLDIGDYGFIEDYFMPFSPGVEYVLSVFDETEKSKDVIKFNQELLTKKLTNLDLEPLEKCAYIIKDIKMSDNNLEILGMLLFKFCSTYKDNANQDFFQNNIQAYQKKYELSQKQMIQIYEKAQNLYELCQQNKIKRLKIN